MAPKRPSPSDQPPSVSSYEDEVEGTEGEEEEVEGVKEEEEESSEEEESGEEEEDDDNAENQPTPIQSSLEKPNPNNQADEDEDAAEDDEENDESGSDSGSDSDNEPVKHMIAPRNSDVKPLSSKPMVDNTPKSKKPTSAASKRPLETDSNDKDSKRDRKKKKISDIEEKDDHTEDTEKKSGEEKKLFQRVFSEKDEIQVLNGLIEFKKKGNRITKDMSEFLGFVKGSLHCEANSSQLTNKVQRLHRKYSKNLKRAKPGSDPTISNPHELRSYLLSKEIWGDQIVKDGVLDENQSGITAGKKSNSKIKSNGVAPSNLKKKNLVLPAISPKVDPKEEDNVIGSQYQYLDQSLKPQNHLTVPMPPPCLGEITAKNGWDMFGSSKAQAFDQRWKSVIIKETEAYLERVALVQEQTKWMLDLHTSSDS